MRQKHDDTTERDHVQRPLVSTYQRVVLTVDTQRSAFSLINSHANKTAELKWENDEGVQSCCASCILTQGPAPRSSLMSLQSIRTSICSLSACHPSIHQDPCLSHTHTVLKQTARGTAPNQYTIASFSLPCLSTSRNRLFLCGSLQKKFHILSTFHGTL
ncbi:hypothetical protein PBY51_016435 [Eleginops maclovinus]|uniref:Uncharacterized protein n=1 Tax=Eleginops maclovinus TaxID=56733 RepID=A0AAN8AMB9_ELEMC|nr:hypothetical protein PBY51_016435 [Eleginops maclovinus]